MPVYKSKSGKEKTVSVSRVVRRAYSNGFRKGWDEGREFEVVRLAGLIQEFTDQYKEHLDDLTTEQKEGYAACLYLFNRVFDQAYKGKEKSTEEKLPFSRRNEVEE